ncbi:MAG: peptidoglycan DD-metalloendopeptidase family protein [Candidatus Brocadiaceae bacterium]
MTIIRKSRFNEFLLTHNDLHKYGFEAWVFYSGMLFNDLYKWWGEGGVRRRPHEGLDICFYQDTGGNIHRLNEKIKIPAIYDGEIVRIGDDFLGKSVYVSHNIYNDTGNKLHTIYGHTNPYSGINMGRILNEGDILATIAETNKRGTTIFPHVHISVAWLPESFPKEQLEWETIYTSRAVILYNPLELMDCKYRNLDC